jgi:hypothetical protein
VAEDLVRHVLLVIPVNQSEADTVDWKVSKDKSKPELTRDDARLGKSIGAEPH